MNNKLATSTFAAVALLSLGASANPGKTVKPVVQKPAAVTKPVTASGAPTQTTTVPGAQNPAANVQGANVQGAAVPGAAGQRPGVPTHTVAPGTTGAPSTGNRAAGGDNCTATEDTGMMGCPG